MIEGAVGYPGAGKTYYAIHRALQEMKKGRPVYSNFGIKGSYPITPESMFSIEPGAFVVLDEAQNWFGSRNWKQFGNRYMEFFSQTRKKQYTLLWLSQDVSSVDKTIRDRTHLIHKMQPMFAGFFGHPLFFIVDTYYGAKNLDKEKFRAWRRFVKFNKETADSYDTFEIVRSRLQDSGAVNEDFNR